MQRARPSCDIVARRAARCLVERGVGGDDADRGGGAGQDAGRHQAARQRRGDATRRAAVELAAAGDHARAGRVDHVAGGVDRDERSDAHAVDLEAGAADAALHRVRDAEQLAHRRAGARADVALRRRLRPTRPRTRRSPLAHRGGCARRPATGRTTPPPARSAPAPGRPSKPMAVFVEPAHHAAGGVESERAAAGEQHARAPGRPGCRGASRSVSRVPGAAPRTSTPQVTARLRTARRCTRWVGASRCDGRPSGPATSVIEPGNSVMREAYLMAGAGPPSARGRWPSAGTAVRRDCLCPASAHKPAAPARGARHRPPGRCGEAHFAQRSEGAKRRPEPTKRLGGNIFSTTSARRGHCRRRAVRTRLVARCLAFRSSRRRVAT